MIWSVIAYGDHDDSSGGAGILARTMGTDLEGLCEM